MTEPKETLTRSRLEMRDSLSENSNWNIYGHKLSIDNEIA